MNNEELFVEETGEIFDVEASQDFNNGKGDDEDE